MRDESRSRQSWLVGFLVFSDSRPLTPDSCQEEVSRFQVAVNEAMRVSVCEPDRRLPDQFARLCRGKWTATPYQRIEAFAFNQFHHQEVRIAGSVGVVSLDNVRVIEPGQRLHLTLKPLGESVAIRQPVMQNLDRHNPVELLLLRPVHRSHSAGTDQSEDFDPLVIEKFGRDSGETADANSERILGKLFEPSATGRTRGNVSFDGFPRGVGERAGIERGELIRGRVFGIGNHCVGIRGKPMRE